ncbi:MAG: hypothetical protein ACM3X3_08915 [Betaproteobacteria bacterium]
MGPDEALSVDCKLTIPRGTYGGRFAAVVFELTPEEKTGEEAFASTEFVQRFAAVAEVAIPAPRVRKAVSISGFSVKAAADDPRYAAAYGKDALILTGEVKNEGNTHVFARSYLTLRDVSGKRLRQIPFGSGWGLVLPETTVNLISVLPSGLAPGNYVADIAVKYGGKAPLYASEEFEVKPALTTARNPPAGAAGRSLFQARPRHVAVEAPGRTCGAGP